MRYLCYILRWSLRNPWQIQSYALETRNFSGTIANLDQSSEFLESKLASRRKQQKPVEILTLTSSQTSCLLNPGRRFMIFSSADFRTPSWVNSTFGFPWSPSTDTFFKYLEKELIRFCLEDNSSIQHHFSLMNSLGFRRTNLLTSSSHKKAGLEVFVLLQLRTVHVSK